ncbi:hypothetical protein AB0A73_21380 [Glycomyces sp. NPDC047369]
MDRGEPYLDALEVCREAAQDGRVVFVLSGLHYMELSHNSSVERRKDLASIMEELSGFKSLLGREAIMKFEIESMLDSKFGRATQTYQSAQLVGDGSGYAFGMKGGFYFGDDNGVDSSAELREMMGAEAFDEMMAEINRLGERYVLGGPEENDLPRLARMGYQSDIAKQAAEKRARQETEQRERHNGTEWGSGPRLTDVIILRELLVELLDLVLADLLRRGFTGVEELISDSTSIRNVVLSMPTALVSALLKAEHHRNYSNAWTSNDIFDIDAMSLAVPYCDIVVTENHRCNDLKKLKLDKKLNTVVLSKLSQLVDQLQPS